MKLLTATAVALGLALAGGPAFAQQATTDPHHPQGAQPPAAAQAPQPAQPGQPGMGMMGGGMMGMMHGAPQGGSQGMMQMGPGRHVEGRLAFLRA